MIEIPIINCSKNALPYYATEHSAGMDIMADISEPIILNSLERVLVPTGLYMALPEGYEAQIRPRSGLALKHGITLLNAPGTIDADYRGEIKIILINLSNQSYTLQPGERIAQMVIAKYEKIIWKLTDTLPDTSRGTGGFGHTGK